MFPQVFRSSKQTHTAATGSVLRTVGMAVGVFALLAAFSPNIARAQEFRTAVDRIDAGDCGPGNCPVPIPTCFYAASDPMISDALPGPGGLPSQVMYEVGLGGSARAVRVEEVDEIYTTPPFGSMPADDASYVTAYQCGTCTWQTTAFHFGHDHTANDLIFAHHAVPNGTCDAPWCDDLDGAGIYIKTRLNSSDINTNGDRILERDFGGRIVLSDWLDGTASPSPCPSGQSGCMKMAFEANTCSAVGTYGSGYCDDTIPQPEIYIANITRDASGANYRVTSVDNVTSLLAADPNCPIGVSYFQYLSLVDMDRTGTRLVFHSSVPFCNSGGGYYVANIPSDRGGPTTLQAALGGPILNDGSPRISADGRYVVYRREHGQNAGAFCLVVADMDTPGAKRVLYINGVQLRSINTVAISTDITGGNGNGQSPVYNIVFRFVNEASLTFPSPCQNAPVVTIGTAILRYDEDAATQPIPSTSINFDVSQVSLLTEGMATYSTLEISDDGKQVAFSADSDLLNYGALITAMPPGPFPPHSGGYNTKTFKCGYTRLAFVFNTVNAVPPGGVPPLLGSCP